MAASSIPSSLISIRLCRLALKIAFKYSGLSPKGMNVYWRLDELKEKEGKQKQDLERAMKLGAEMRMAKDDGAREDILKQFQQLYLNAYPDGQNPEDFSFPSLAELSSYAVNFYQDSEGKIKHLSVVGVLPDPVSAYVELHAFKSGKVWGFDNSYVLQELFLLSRKPAYLIPEDLSEVMREFAYFGDEYDLEDLFNLGLRIDPNGYISTGRGVFHGENLPLLFGAAKMGKVKNVRKLVEKGADLEKAKLDGVTLMSIFAEHAYSVEGLEWLVQKWGFSVDTPVPQLEIQLDNMEKNGGIYCAGATLLPIQIAANHGNVPGVLKLIELGAVPNNDVLDDALRAACEDPTVSPRMLKQLLSFGIDVNKVYTGKFPRCRPGPGSSELFFPLKRLIASASEFSGRSKSLTNFRDKLLILLRLPQIDLDQVVKSNLLGKNPGEENLSVLWYAILNDLFCSLIPTHSFFVEQLIMAGAKLTDPPEIPSCKFKILALDKQLVVECKSNDHTAEAKESSELLNKMVANGLAKRQTILRLMGFLRERSATSEQVHGISVCFRELTELQVGLTDFSECSLPKLSPTQESQLKAIMFKLSELNDDIKEPSRENARKLCDIQTTIDTLRGSLGCSNVAFFGRMPFADSDTPKLILGRALCEIRTGLQKISMPMPQPVEKESVKAGSDKSEELAVLNPCAAGRKL